ncbi:MAG: DUF2569 domain-containing protein [Methylobacter sp.]|uniref:DUF2569 family protein n=1 Tax=Methylobacter sp. TaxID=2051955 RepID=UPI0025D0E4A4|nr:DUF2569 family protein [Methylobacter sp.]MCK9623102.1 DUF2569 domain-containing protein [Methylobacter sp.]
MNLPNAKQRQRYIDSVKALEEALKHATETGISDVALHSAQEQLDTLAEKYQNDEKIGTARYKLYELQAFICYFEHKDNEALDFIDQAIKTKGSSYPKAEKLKDTLSAPTKANIQPSSIDESKMTKTQKRKKLIGLEGWLALFIVGQFLALLITIYGFFADGFTSWSDINALNEYQSGLGNSLQALTTFENLAILIYVTLVITTLVLLFRRSKLAKAFAIATLVFSAIYGILDYAVASSIFSSSDIFQTAETQSLMSKYAGDVGRSIITALIWAPYFLVSKRIKATLTK